MNKDIFLYEIKEFFKGLAKIFKCYFKIGNKDIDFIDRILITTILGLIILLIVLFNHTFLF